MGRNSLENRPLRYAILSNRSESCATLFSAVISLSHPSQHAPRNNIPTVPPGSNFPHMRSFSRQLDVPVIKVAECLAGKGSIVHALSMTIRRSIMLSIIPTIYCSLTELPFFLIVYGFPPLGEVKLSVGVFSLKYSILSVVFE